MLCNFFLIQIAQNIWFESIKEPWSFYSFFPVFFNFIANKQFLRNWENLFSFALTWFILSANSIIQ